MLSSILHCSGLEHVTDDLLQGDGADGSLEEDFLDPLGTDGLEGGKEEEEFPEPSWLVGVRASDVL